MLRRRALEVNALVADETPPKSKPFTIAAADRIAQLVIAKVTRATLRQVEVLDDTARGAGGFGSTDQGRRQGG